MTRYEYYLTTETWKRKADQRRRIDKYTCQMCGYWHERLEVHHLSYDRIYHENVYIDLVTLCPDCHEKVHRMMNRQVNEFGDKGWGRLRKLHEE